VIHQVDARVVHAERAGRDMALLVLEAAEIATGARPGQFVMVRCGDHSLRRPLSIHAAGDGRLALLFRVAGGGTAWLADLGVGATVSLTGPLGNGYSLPAPEERSLLVAGGMGIAPLSFLATQLAGSAAVTLAYGARCAEELYHPSDALRRLLPLTGWPGDVPTIMATDDGSSGVHGTALQLALPLLDRVERVYMCGPVGMCAAACDYTNVQGDVVGDCMAAACSQVARERLLSAEVSLEVRMGCGVGACYGCSIPTRNGRRKVCTDGPVFRFGDVIWESVRT
jgi:dihydroorotate dehydrogenase electron transfer subunit